MHDERSMNASGGMVNTDAGNGNAVCRLIWIASFPADVADRVVTELSSIVRHGHDAASKGTLAADCAQFFEEGRVLLVEHSTPDFQASRYLMDLYDVREQGVCSRMHAHTGPRLVRIMTGSDTVLRITTLLPPTLTTAVGGPAPLSVSSETGHLDGVPVKTHIVDVPQNSWVDLQIPTGSAHQFNASGPMAVIDTVHPMELSELHAENLVHGSMTAQTVFLTEERPPSSDCEVRQ